MPSVSCPRAFGATSALPRRQIRNSLRSAGYSHQISRGHRLEGNERNSFDLSHEGMQHSKLFVKQPVIHVNQPICKHVHVHTEVTCALQVKHDWRTESFVRQLIVWDRTNPKVWIYCTVYLHSLHVVVLYRLPTSIPA